MAIDYIVAKEDYDEYMETIKSQKQEIERLNNIIKEVREYIKKSFNTDWKINLVDIIEILDKGE